MAYVGYRFGMMNVSDDTHSCEGDAIVSDMPRKKLLFLKKIEFGLSSFFYEEFCNENSDK